MHKPCKRKNDHITPDELNLRPAIPRPLVSCRIRCVRAEQAAIEKHVLRRGMRTLRVCLHVEGLLLCESFRRSFAESEDSFSLL